VQSTFLVFWLFPPPTAGSNILSHADSARAARAPDAEEPLVVKGIVRNFVLPDEVPHLRFRPIPKRIDLDDSKLFVPFDNMNTLASQRLIPPKTTNPSVDSTQCPHQGMDLSYRAAKLAILHALIEQVNAVFGHHRLHFISLRRKDLNLARVSGFCPINQFVGLRE
jgi:hypothetical protein